ncbi:hypothetical protein OPT61_g4951 [Boeremia exigua]|uniref:Uncharacterized protein n=1 Tax=Boeremia exigua TaxID=749465 RepID=A0ACC2IC78_9PLEO|nr:hypothetical protein OPT61_g4951 [Boeremia exigua]
MAHSSPPWLVSDSTTSARNWLVPDTGSSDLWIPVADFQCVDQEGSDVSQEACNLGLKYHVPDSTEYVANQTFGVKYGTGIALGKVAYADVTVNGITAKRQKIGLVDRTNDVGDGIGSGIFGLGFPALTSAHPGTTLDNETLLFNRAVYDPVFVSMYKQGLIEPWYSFAINRPLKNTTTGPGGWFGLGELPPVAYADDWAVKKIEATSGLPDELTQGRREISLMTLTVDGMTWKNPTSNYTATNTTSFQAVVDTGNHMNLVPSAIATAINDAFSPPGIFNETLHVYVVDCNATTPEVGVILDGKTFWHKLPEDLIYHDASGICYSSFAPTAEEAGLVLNFLGDAFLRTVVAVLDFGKEEMRFAARLGDADGEPPVFEGAAVPNSNLSWLCICLVSAMVWFLFFM